MLIRVVVGGGLPGCFSSEKKTDPPKTGDDGRGGEDALRGEVQFNQPKIKTEDIKIPHDPRQEQDNRKDDPPDKFFVFKEAWFKEKGIGHDDAGPEKAGIFGEGRKPARYPA